MEQLSADQVKKYLESPDTCPFCDSEDIDAGWVSADGASAYSAVKCNSCGTEWLDVFKLVDIEITCGPSVQAEIQDET
jgi:formate dehydrogenase maturation protein FdhE